MTSCKLVNAFVEVEDNDHEDDEKKGEEEGSDEFLHDVPVNHGQAESIGQLT